MADGNFNIQKLQYFCFLHRKIITFYWKNLNAINSLPPFHFQPQNHTRKHLRYMRKFNCFKWIFVYIKSTNDNISVYIGKILMPALEGNIYIGKFSKPVIILKKN